MNAVDTKTEMLTLFKWVSFQAPGMEPVSASVEPGQVVILFSADPALSETFQSASLGWTHSLSGSTWIQGTQLQTQNEDSRLEIMQQIGAIEKGGGFLSNLCVWENILLPSAYRSGRPTGEFLDLLKDAVNKIGIPKEDIDRNLTSRVDELSETRRILLALARESIHSPLIWMLHNVLDDLPTRGLKQAKKEIDRLADENAEAGWIIYTCEEPVADSFPGAKRIYLEELKSEPTAKSSAPI